jgi:hypothetical protein
MADDILFKARSNLASQLRQLKELDESSVTEVLNSNYLKPFNDQTPTAEGNFLKKISHVHFFH